MNKNLFADVSNVSFMNTDRAEWAMQAVETFADTTGLDVDSEIEVAIGDLTCNLMHLCKQKNIDFDEMLAAAERMYQADVQEEAKVPD